MTAGVTPNLEWKRVLVYGLGLSGLAALRLLRRQGVEVLAVDGRSDVELGTAASDLSDDGGVEWRLGDESPDLPEDVEAIILSPGVPPERPLLAAARRRQIPILAEVELAYRLADGPIVAITGSNGKSTTTALTGALLQAAGREVEVCGNIGRPLSDCVAGAAGRTFVVELSSFQLESTDRFHPKAAALLNVTADHLDRYGSLESYAAAKARIFSRQGAGDVAVLNADDDVASRIEVPVAVRRRTFSRRRQVEDGCYLKEREVLEVAPGLESRKLFDCADVPLEGLHHLENAMAASLLARALGTEPSELELGLRSFEGLPHRLQRIAERAGVLYYDDSKGTNVAATAASLAGFDDRSVHLILGGRHKGGDLGDLRPMVERKVRALYLVGEAAPLFAEALESVAPIFAVGNLENAVEAAAGRARRGEVVLLSPACASFDQFRSFVERGERFQELVRELGEGDDG